MRRKPESGFEQYLRRVYRAVSGTRAEKKRETARVQSLLCEIPHAETMSYDIVRPPVHRRALQRDFKAAEPKARSCFRQLC